MERPSDSTPMIQKWSNADDHEAGLPPDEVTVLTEAGEEATATDSLE